MTLEQMMTTLETLEQTEDVEVLRYSAKNGCNPNSEVTSVYVTFCDCDANWDEREYTNAELAEELEDWVYQNTVGDFTHHTKINGVKFRFAWESQDE